jgi:hypothetical protein
MVQRIQQFTAHFEFTSPDLKAKLQPLCSKVLKEFPKAPPLRLLCYFDGAQPEWLQHQFGEFTGIHTPIIGGGTWPLYVSKHFFNSSGGFAYDDLIYIPKSKYVEQQVPFVMVFAHEIQHFVQRGFTPKISKANTLLLWNLIRFDPMTELKPWELPNNREAMIIAKKVADSVCGKEAVQDFVHTQIEDAKNSHNASKAQLWQWVKTFKSSASYDLLRETDRFVQRYKPQLQSLKSDIDFSKAKWWL